MTGWRRTLGEHRRLAIGMAAIALLNVAVYLFVVRPLAFRVATIEDRDRQAEQTLRAARAEAQAVSGALSGKERAVKELATFYQTVLPADLAAARRVTHLRLAQLAREAGLTFERFSFEPEPVKGSDLTRVKGEMVLTGSYGEVRRFVHKVETSKDFVVLDDLSLAEGTDNGSELVVTLKLSTYFRTVAS
ncbi:MAG: type 4a pilus biogenesis protein PilO [Vicinamibacterales bacterium]